MPLAIQTKLKVVSRRLASFLKSKPSEREQLRRVGVPVPVSNAELRAFAQRSLARQALWFALKYAFWAFLTYFVVCGFMLLAARGGGQ